MAIRTHEFFVRHLNILIWLLILSLLAVGIISNVRPRSYFVTNLLALSVSGVREFPMGHFYAEWVQLLQYTEIMSFKLLYYSNISKQKSLTKNLKGLLRYCLRYSPFIFEPFVLHVVLRYSLLGKQLQMKF